MNLNYCIDPYLNLEGYDQLWIPSIPQVRVCSHYKYKGGHLFYSSFFPVLEYLFYVKMLDVVHGRCLQPDNDALNVKKLCGKSQWAYNLYNLFPSIMSRVSME